MSNKKTKPKTSASANVEYIGCYTREEDLGSDRLYGGSTTGSYFRLAKHYAEANGMSVWMDKLVLRMQQL